MAQLSTLSQVKDLLITLCNPWPNPCQLSSLALWVFMGLLPAPPSFSSPTGPGPGLSNHSLGLGSNCRLLPSAWSPCPLWHLWTRDPCARPSEGHCPNLAPSVPGCNCIYIKDKIALPIYVCLVICKTPTGPLAIFPQTNFAC